MRTLQTKAPGHGDLERGKQTDKDKDRRTEDARRAPCGEAEQHEGGTQRWPEGRQTCGVGRSPAGQAAETPTLGGGLEQR